MENKPVITRFAPSPTGFLHVGGVRTALFSYIFAKQNGGHFLLRVEDTDKERSKKEYEAEIVTDMDWLGLDYGDNYFRQSDRLDIYKKYLKKLIDGGHAYVSKEPVEVSGKAEGEKNYKKPEKTGKGDMRAEVIRFKNPNKKISIEDLIRGRVEFDTTELGDFVIAKSHDEPLYHLAVVVDDHEMNVTHVIRGEEHLSNTSRQILIQEALGAPRPIYAHLPLILAADRSKLSKRKHGEKVSLKYYIDRGYLPQAMINYLALLGWNPGTDQEIFTLEELLKKFDLSKVQKGGAIFDETKLRWINKQHMLRLPKEELYTGIKESLGDFDVPGDLLIKLSPVLLERADTFGDVADMAKGSELDYLSKEPTYEASGLLWKGRGELVTTKKRLEHVLAIIEAVKDKTSADKNKNSDIDTGGFNKESIKIAIWDYATSDGRGEVLWPMRFALSGKEKSPDPFVLAELLGQKETIKRLKTAIKKCG
jgi:glutamyl-tRNA synthetase